MILTTKNLAHWYTDESSKLYSDVNLTFGSNKFYAIIGESGSGKTTILSFLAGLDVPCAGEIAIDGVSINKIGLTKYRQRYVATIFQSYNLLTSMTAYQNIETALAITRSSHKGDRQYILEQLARVGITKRKPLKMFRNFLVVNSNVLLSCERYLLMHRLLRLMKDRKLRP